MLRRRRLVLTMLDVVRSNPSGVSVVAEDTESPRGLYGEMGDARACKQ